MKRTNLAVFGALISALVFASSASAALVQYFPFDGDVANAISGGYAATNAGAGFTSTQVAPGIGSSHAADFLIAEGDRITIGGPTAIAGLQTLFHGDFSVSTWARSNIPGNSPTINNNIAYVFDFGSSHSNGLGVGFDRGHGFMAEAGGRIGGYYNGSDLNNAGTNPIGNQDQWYHFVVTRSGSTVRLYLDGALIDTTTVASPALSTSFPFTIGGEAKAAQRFWDGQVDDLGMFNQALSLGQILAIGNVADTSDLSLNLGEMADLFDLHSTASITAVKVVDGTYWMYDDSSFLAGLGVGNVGLLDGRYYINLDGLTGVAYAPPIPEPNSLALLSLGLLFVTKRASMRSRGRARTNS